MAALPLRAAYYLSDLARAASMSRWRMRRLLEGSGVEVMRVGRMTLIPLSELEAKVWPIWEGIKAAEVLRQAIDPADIE